MRILLFSDIAMPDGCALATRVIEFAKLLQALGCETVVLGVSYQTGVPLNGTCDGIDYQMLQAKQYYGIHAYKRIAHLKQDICRFLNESPQFDAVLLSNVYFDYADIFLKYARKHNARLMMNAVEWYDRGDALFGGPLGFIKLLKNRIALRVLHTKMDSISISTLLGNYYREKGCRTVVIPTIVDLEKYRGVTHTPNEKLVIAYAGSPARKDYLPNTLRAIASLSDEDRARIEMHIYGATEAAFAPFGLDAAFFEKHRECIVAHGRIPHTEVKQKIADADFTVLLRPDKRYANAGFPTKVGESMACGTPVIANLTSDLGKYVLDGKTGIVCKNESVESCADAFRRALQLTEDERAEMRLHCLKMARQSFDYRAYTKVMETFLKG